VWLVFCGVGGFSDVGEYFHSIFDCKLFNFIITNEDPANGYGEVVYGGSNGGDGWIGGK